MSESLIDGAAEAPAESDATSRDYVIESDVTSQTDRPEWLPEKYSTGEDLAKAYKELESKLGNKEEDIKSYENGFSQEEFQQGIEMYAASMPGNEGPDLEAEAQKLGENADTRIQAASMFATKFFPTDALPAIERMCESHEGIIALEAIQEALKGGSFSGNTQPTAGLNEAKLREMMSDPRYHNPRDRDPNFVREVEAGFKQIYRS